MNKIEHLIFEKDVSDGAATVAARDAVAAIGAIKPRDAASKRRAARLLNTSALLDDAAWDASTRLLNARRELLTDHQLPTQPNL